MVHVALLILMLLTGQHNADSIATDDVKFLKPFDFDVLLSDINEGDLYLIAEMEGAPYLNISSTQEPGFPVEGLVMGMNRRYMINLSVRRKNTKHFKNVVFMIDTGSPYTFLSRTAMKAMVGSGENIPPIMKLEIQGKAPVICYLSPSDKHFADVNLLGMDFLEMSRSNLVTDWQKKTFIMHDYNSFWLHTENKCH
jgi:hypothetical protein